MLNSLSMRKPNVLDSISLNVPRATAAIELDTKGIKQEQVNSIIQATESRASSNENKSLSSRSSLSEFSDVVKLNGSTEASNKQILNPQSVLESKPTIALFIGDLDEKIDEDILTEIFSKFRSLISVKVCTDSATGKSLGYGYLNFLEKQDSVAATEEFNYRPIFGKEVRIMPSLRNAFYRKNMGTNIFFSNLPLEDPNLTTRVFYDTFKVFGNILSCKLDKRKNIGFVYFDNDHSARKVIKEFNGKEFFGNKILCGIHFDKELRRFPEFEKRKSSLNDITIPKEQLTFDDNEMVSDNSPQYMPHPNAIFVKNLPPNCTDDEILDYFSKLGPVKSVFSSTSYKHRSIWAFITYKRSSDANKALKVYHDSHFKGRKLNVIKAELTKKAKKEERGHKRSSNQRNPIVVYLHNLSSVCNERFLLQMCLEEHIKIENLAITDFYQDSLTYSGYIKCRSKKDANKTLKILNNRLIGGCEVQATEEKQIKNNSNVGNESSIPVIDMTKNQFIRSTVFPLTMYPAPVAGQMYYPPPMILTSKIATFNNERDENSTQVLKYLKREVKRGMDFLRYPVADVDKIVLKITNYIFEHRWHSDLNQLTKFLLLIHTNIQNERILISFIEEAAKHFGLET